jgi:hypothetical protein
MIGAIPVTGMYIPEDLVSENTRSYLLEKVEDMADDNFTLPPEFVFTFGPVKKRITEFTVLDGPEDKTAKIEKLMNRRFVLFSRLLPFYMVTVIGMNFTMEYKKDVRNGSRLTYASINCSIIFNESGDPVNVSNLSYIRNDVHKIKVENFSGVFLFTRARLFRGFLTTSAHLFFIPARGIFTGYCDKVTYLPVAQ